MACGELSEAKRRLSCRGVGINGKLRDSLVLEVSWQTREGARGLRNSKRRPGLLRGGAGRRRRSWQLLPSQSNFCSWWHGGINRDGNKNKKKSKNTKEKKSMSKKQQHRFIESKSCQTNPITFSDWIYKISEQNAVNVYLDFGKAFDTLPPKMWLEKWTNIGLNMNAAAWF